MSVDYAGVTERQQKVWGLGDYIGMANWTPDSMVGDMFRAVAQHVPPPPGVAPAVAWGTEERVAELLDRHCRDQQAVRRTCPFRFPSAQVAVRS